MSFDLTRFFELYGHDMEVAERREIQTGCARTQAWFEEWAGNLCLWYESAAGCACALAPDDSEIESLACRAAVYGMLTGAVEGGQWTHVTVFGSGQTVNPIRFLPYQQLFALLTDNCAVPCTFEQAHAAVAARQPLFAAEGRLTTRLLRTLLAAADPHPARLCPARLPAGRTGHPAVGADRMPHALLWPRAHRAA